MKTMLFCMRGGVRRVENALKVTRLQTALVPTLSSHPRLIWKVALQARAIADQRVPLEHLRDP